VAVSFIGGGNQRTQRKPPTYALYVIHIYNVVAKSIYGLKQCLSLYIYIPNGSTVF